MGGGRARARAAPAKAHNPATTPAPPAPHPQVTFNPRDANTFASASLDRSVTVWSLSQPPPAYTHDGHDKGVNAVDYARGGDRPYLVSGADDRTARVWDYQTKACVHVLEGHGHNVSGVAFHPSLPLIVTACEDGAARLWHSATYRLEASLSYGLERCWAVGVSPTSNAIALGCDDGVALVTAGRDEPAASMDGAGKRVWARQADVCGANVKALGAALEAADDGERLPLAAKDLGTCDSYPTTLAHSPNGRFVAAVGDGEWVVYTALAWRSKAFGPGLDFAWADDSAAHAARESPTVVKIYRQLKEALTLRLPFAADGVHGGALLAARGADCVVFYEWATGGRARRRGRHVRLLVRVPHPGRHRGRGRVLPAALRRGRGGGRGRGGRGGPGRRGRRRV